jgi:S-adenosylmethionine synthetase
VRISPLAPAKSLVAAGLARRVLVQLSYAIGVAEPLSIFVDTYGTGKKTNEELVEIIRNNWDLRPGVIGSDFACLSVDNFELTILSSSGT